MCAFLCLEPNREVGISAGQVGQLTLMVAVAAWPAWSKRALEGGQYRLVQGITAIGSSLSAERNVHCKRVALNEFLQTT